MNRSRMQGVALPIVLWSIAFIAGLVVLVAAAVGDWTGEEIRAERAFRARQMALSGVAVGLNPAVKAGDPLLTFGSKSSEGYEVRITNEAGKINPNFWIAQNNKDIFNALFLSWGVNESATEAAIDGLTDWIDADDFPLLHGAERAEYDAAGHPGLPPNRPLTSIREMPAILGLDRVLADHPDWQDYFTTWHNGKINIRYAAAPVLAAVAGLTQSQIEALFELRAGPDGVEGSDDDSQLGSIESVAQLIGADGRQLAALEAFFDVTGSVRRVESTGYCQGTRHRIVAIAPDQPGFSLLSWEEQ